MKVSRWWLQGLNLWSNDPKSEIQLMIHDQKSCGGLQYSLRLVWSSQLQHTKNFEQHWKGPENSWKINSKQINIHWICTKNHRRTENFHWEKVVLHYFLSSDNFQCFFSITISALLNTHIFSALKFQSIMTYILIAHNWQNWKRCSFCVTAIEFIG